MQRWQGTRRAHCVIDRISSRSTSSSEGLLAARHFRQYHHQSSFQPLHQRYTFLVTLPRKSIRLPSFRASPSNTVITRNMSSDDAYMAFLEKASADRNQPSQTTSPSVARTETVDVGVRVPAPLASIDAFYISETDEPFEPVTLKWDGASRGLWPDASHLSSLISPTTDLSSSITTLPASSFDPKNQYSGPLRAVRAAAALASGGDESAVELKVYRVEVGTSRVEYYVLALDAEQGLLVGLRAKAVET